MKDLVESHFTGEENKEAFIEGRKFREYDKNMDFTLVKKLSVDLYKASDMLHSTSTKNTVMSLIIDDLINNAKHGESGVLYKDSSIQRELKANISDYRQELAHLGIDIIESKRLPMIGVSFNEAYERVLCTHLGWEDRL